MKKVTFYNTLLDHYKGWDFNLLPFIKILKEPWLADYHIYLVCIGWLAWEIQIILKDESENIDIKPLEEQQ